jgi:hypothetical protein
MTRHEHPQSTTLLSLSLSPHRVGTCTTLFITQVFHAVMLPLRNTHLLFSWLETPSGCVVDALERLCE